jgi:hypothetical protein
MSQTTQLRRRAGYRAARRPAHRQPSSEPLTWLGKHRGISTREQLAAALLLMAGRFVSPADPPLVIWLLGHAAAGIATGLALTAVWQSTARHWWRPCATVGAGAFQLGVLLGWRSAMDTDRALQSAPVLLCALGALAVAVATLGFPHSNLREPHREPAWPGPVALGSLLGYVALAIGAAHLFALDITSIMGGDSAGGMDPSAMADIMGGGGMGGMDPSAMLEMLGQQGMDPSALLGDRFSSMSQLVRSVVVLVTVTPVAIGALVYARRSRQPALSTGGFLVVVLLPVLAAGGVGTALGLAVTVGVVAVIVIRLQAGVDALFALPSIPAVVLAGTALAIGVSHPLHLMGVAVYGALLGGLLVYATPGDLERPSHTRRARLLRAQSR